jgi:hypothetical protein
MCQGLAVPGEAVEELRCEAYEPGVGQPLGLVVDVLHHAVALMQPDDRRALLLI